MDRLELYNKIYEQEKLITYLINQRNEWINKYDSLLKRKSIRGIRDTEIIYCKFCNIAIMAGTISYQAEGNHLQSKTHIKNVKHYSDSKYNEFLQAREAEYNRVKKNIASSYINPNNNFEPLIIDFENTRVEDIIQNIEFEQELDQIL